MTMTINLQTGGGYIPPQPLPGARSADIQVGQKQVQEYTLPTAPASGENAASVPALAEQKRYEQVVLAAKNMFKDVYVVSDRNFSIFKDASGQYITRYTSLRDGRVTYIPEPKLLQAFENSQRTNKPILQIQA
jgi:hypothetical protein